jgi:hypothetical protein
LELFRQCGILELFRQCGILELFRQCGILELFRQCGILELFRQCGIFVFIFYTVTITDINILTYIQQDSIGTHLLFTSFVFYDTIEKN